MQIFPLPSETEKGTTSVPDAALGNLGTTYLGHVAGTHHYLPHRVALSTGQCASFPGALVAKFSMDSFQGIPISQRAERADPVPDAKWEKHRETIRKMYIDRGMKLDALITYMAEKHDFSARQVAAIHDF